MASNKSEQMGVSQKDKRAEQMKAARDERVRMIVAARELENALSAASWHRERDWHRRVQDSLLVLQTALKDTRNSADEEGSLLSDVVSEAPRLDTRVRRIRDEYEELERHVESLRFQLAELENDEEQNVDDIRQRLNWLITALQHVQSKETELLYEAFQVDIGLGD